VPLFFFWRPALPVRGFWSFHDPALIGRHAGGTSEDFREIVKPFRLRLQLRFEATREVRYTIGAGKAEPLGELGQSGLGVAAAQPGCDRPCSVGVVRLRKQGGFDFVEVHHGSEDSLRVAAREPPRFGDGCLRNGGAGKLVEEMVRSPPSPLGFTPRNIEIREQTNGLYMNEQSN
jgi:hypothetical protein